MRCASASRRTRRRAICSRAWSRGIGGYGNCVGVPTVGGECTFHRAYNGNILVNAMCVGVARKDRVFYAAAAGIGNPVVYVGAKTGRDGIHGATMASAEFTEESEAKRPTVQVGDPFTEKLLIEACLELMEEDCIVAIQDMGAAGLTSSSFEMAARGGVRDRARPRCRAAARAGHDRLRDHALGEPGADAHGAPRRPRGRVARRIFDKWELDFAIVGRVTDTGRMVLRQGGEVVADLPVAPVAGASPVYERPFEVPEHRPPRPGDARPASRTARPCSASWPRPIWPASAGSGSSTTTRSWATRCSGRAATPPWSACTARPRAWR